MFQQKLLSWYRKNKRDLPWRRTKDPYAIWISEIMLQQTTVEAVIPYYEKFLKKFTDVKALAQASEENVLRLWSGLGYYSRARNLHLAAQMIVQSCVVKSVMARSKSDVAISQIFQGDRHARLGWLAMTSQQQNPIATVEELQKLPGIGRYTAGAIASIAFDLKAPIVDGNVVRVLSRLFRIGVDPKSSPGQKTFWKKAEDILPDTYVGDFNQALMELGATVCLPESPLCLSCPINSHCKAHEKGVTSKYPTGRKKIQYRDVALTAAVIQKDGKILMVQRPHHGLMKGLWEIPMVEGKIDALTKKWPVEILRAFPTIRHSVLNRRLKIQPLICRLTGELAQKEHRWIRPHEITNLPTSSMNQKILQKIR